MVRRLTPTCAQAWRIESVCRSEIMGGLQPLTTTAFVSDALRRACSDSVSDWEFADDSGGSRGLQKSILQPKGPSEGRRVRGDRAMEIEAGLLPVSLHGPLGHAAQRRDFHR